MGWYEEFIKVLSTTRQQLKGQSIPKPKDIHVTNNFYTIAKARGLSELDALDVYYHGSVVKQNMMKRQYNGYELGFTSSKIILLDKQLSLQSGSARKTIELKPPPDIHHNFYRLINPLIST